MREITIELLSENAKAPTRAYEEDAGLDLYSPESFMLAPGEHRKVATNVAFDLQPGEVALVQPRSSMSARQIHTYTGVIDAGYKGDVSVMLHNLGQSEQLFGRHDRIAQLLIMDVKLVKSRVGKIQLKSKRGQNGFGSTGR